MDSVEIFKEIRGFPGYQISNLGRVKSLKTNKFLKPRFNTSGYLRVNLYHNGKCNDKEIHILVAQAFFEANHKDGDKTNNRLSNLEMLTHDKNMFHAGKLGLMKSKIPFKDRAKIIHMRKTKSIYAIAKIYNVKFDTIKNLLRRANAAS